jgi:hypothetical protein
MNKLGFALVGAASLALAGCGGNTDDSLNNADAYNTTGNLDALANDAANTAEAEALGNQQQQLEDEGAGNNAAADELNATDTDDTDENVSGM